MLAWRRTLVAKKFDGSRQRKKATTWHEFIRAHQDVLVATDFFTTQV
jgi:hypothetical protein